MSRFHARPAHVLKVGLQNSANIIVANRLTGQLQEEKISVYVRVGIRLLYKGLGAGRMEGARSSSTTEPDIPSETDVWCHSSPHAQIHVC